MTNKQLHLMKLLENQGSQYKSFVFWAYNGVEEKDIIELQDQGLIFVQLSEGFQDGLRKLSLTAKGQSFIKDFCDVCECMPCDCDWGY